MYRIEQLFPYASGYYSIFPRGLESRFDGRGSIVIEDDYIIFFIPNTPENIKQRFIKEYAEYHKSKLEEQKNGIYR